MPSDLSSYLAKNYLVADPKPTKKRKRKQAAEGLIIADDDDASWAKPQASANDDVDGPATVDGSSAEFRRTKKSNWKSITGAPTSTPANADADALPTFDDAGVAKMSDGTHAGLQSAATVSAQLRRRQAAEQAEFARMKAGGREEETVYRDATGRRVDVSMRRAEARRAAAEAEEREKERQAKIAPKGDVQAAAANARREALEEAKTMAFARGADDEDMNREMKGKERWNDPMAQFMQTDTATTTTGGKGKKGKNRPVYTGGAQPNRYGIRPGYRWDGVDRSNGFEGERFKAINRRERNKGLDYSWQMDE
ncbi:hypothetical protein BN1708_010839, partial [Verticillium longisporum]